MSPVVNLASLVSNVEKVPDYTPVPDGAYYAVAENVTFPEPKQGKSPYIKADLTIVLSDQHGGHKVFNNMYLSESAAPWTLQNIEKGWGITQEAIVAAGANGEKMLAEKMKAPVLVTLTTREYEDSEGVTRKTNEVARGGFARPEESVYARYEAEKAKKGASKPKVTAPTAPSSPASPTATNNYGASAPAVPDFDDADFGG